MQEMARRAEAAGWDGISLTDSQNLIGDPFIAMALGRAGHRAAAVHDRRDQPGHPPPGRAGHHHRHGAGGVRRPGRARHRAGRHRALPPRAPAHADRGLLPGRRAGCTPTCNGGTVDQRGRPSRLRWLDRATQPPVPRRHRGVRPEGHRVRGPHGRADHVRDRRRPRAGGLGARPGPHRDARRRPGRGRRVVRGLRQRRLPPRRRRRLGAHPRRAGRVRALLGHARIDRRRPVRRTTRNWSPRSAAATTATSTS